MNSKFKDELTNIVYFAEYLKSRYPLVFQSSKVALESNGIEVRTITDTKNIWCRDYMPVQVGDHFVKFGYKTAEYDDYPQLQVADSCWSGLTFPFISSPIILDGGNCQRFEDKTIVTEIVFKHNPDIPKKELINQLEKLFESEIVIIPAEPGDDLGHADGILKFIDEKRVFVNDYSVMKQPQYDKYQDKLMKALNEHEISQELFPYAYHLCPPTDEKAFRVRYPEADDYNPGFGYYINFLLMKGIILFPIMNISEDSKVLEKLKLFYPDFSIMPIDCQDLSMEGGLINCVSWNIMS